MKKALMALMLAIGVITATETTSAQFTDTKNPPAKDQSHDVQFLYDKGWLWIFWEQSPYKTNRPIVFIK